MLVCPRLQPFSYCTLPCTRHPVIPLLPCKHAAVLDVPYSFSCCVLDCDGFQAKQCCIACRKRHALRIGAAPEPSDIVWENLEITTAQRLQRRVFILLVNVIIIFAGVSPCACAHAPCQAVGLYFCCRSELHDSCRGTLLVYISGSGSRVPFRQRQLCTCCSSGPAAAQPRHHFR